jgi:hypothetical protein
MKKLFIDDIRDPPATGYDVVRTSEAAIEWLKTNGIPNVISFDHDLGGDDTTIRVIRHIYDLILDEKGSFPDGFTCIVHSANPVGAQNIKHDMVFILTHLADIKNWSVVLREYPQ